MVNKEDNKKINWGIIFSYLFLISLCINIALLGAVLNQTAVCNNGNRMPVYDEDLVLNNSKHFAFSNKSQVNNFYLTDIFEVRTYHFSIGDFLMFSALIVLLIEYVSYGVWLMKS